MIEKHLRVLLQASIVEKVPALSGRGNLTIRYRLREGPRELLALARKLITND